MTIPSLSYTAPARWLHWSMAVLVLAMVPVGFLMVQQGLPRALQNALFIFHKNVGVLLLVLIVLRSLYRWRRPPPSSDLPQWQLTIARFTHGALYVLLFLMPLAGYIRVRAGGFPIEALDAMGVPALIPKSEAVAGIAKSVHYYGAWAIAILIGLHIAAALRHAFIKRDGVMARMWVPRE